MVGLRVIPKTLVRVDVEVETEAETEAEAKPDEGDVRPIAAKEKPDSGFT